MEEFSISYQDNKFKIMHSSLDDRSAEYLENYLRKINRYKPIKTGNHGPLYSLYQPPIATHVGHRALQHRLKRRFNQARIPASATISVTSACQCDCEHCSAVYYNHATRPRLSTEQLKQAIFESVELGVTTIIFLGGEPLLHPQLCELIKSVPQDQATSILFTNGELLSVKKCQELKSAGLMGAFVSIDSPDLKIHDLLRKRKKLFDKAMQGIQNLLNADLVAGISTYISPDNLAAQDFEKIMELGKASGVQEITFFDAIPSGKWMHQRNHILKIHHREQIRKLVRFYRDKTGYPGISAQSLLTSECGSSFCFAGNTQFYLTAFGEMCPCDFTPLSVGQFPQKSIAELWKKMIQTSPYQEQAKCCRMQDETFYQNYISKIPKLGPYPFPMDELQQLRVLVDS